MLRFREWIDVFDTNTVALEAVTEQHRLSLMGALPLALLLSRVAVTAAIGFAGKYKTTWMEGIPA